MGKNDSALRRGIDRGGLQRQRMESSLFRAECMTLTFPSSSFYTKRRHGLWQRVRLYLDKETDIANSRKLAGTSLTKLLLAHVVSLWMMRL
jgi:hypothetical protein